ncbi:MAG: hypothetical protein OEV00_16375 [Acidobacteriota bacterium]|nr:hypothetical protein [Acidobacteriota bacterium]MDH3786888.1 hypothetical protein [Acidobacteriota bacterium]
MASITNKTSAPLAISLPGGKKLRLGPFKTGEIGAKAIDHPAVQKLVEAGEVEIDGADHKQRHSGGGGKGTRNASGGPGQSGNIRRSGDR